MKTITMQLEEITCPSCMTKIEAALDYQKGISAVKVMYTLSRVKVSFDESIINKEQIKNTILNLGYEVM